MKVKYLGFELSTEKDLITIKDFIENNLNFIDKDILERDFFIDDTDENYFKGLVLTIKDQKAFCKLQGARDNLAIKVHNLEGSDELIEFNFFIINKNTRKGLYQFYYQSTSLSKFKEILKRKFIEYRSIKLQEEYDKNIALGQSERLSKNNANKKFYDRLKFEFIVKKSTLSVLLQKCKRIKSLEVEFATYEYIQKMGMPAPAFATKIRQKVLFDKDAILTKLASEITSYISKECPESGIVNVIDEFGQEMPYKLMNTPDLFHEEEFDELVQKMNDVRVSNFTESTILEDMIKIYESSRVLS